MRENDRVFQESERKVLYLRVALSSTNRWTGATGSEFRIIIDPAELLGNAVARSTQPFGGSLL